MDPFRGVLPWLALACIACSGTQGRAEAFDPERPWRRPGDVIDSILPMEDLLARFREGQPRPDGFTGGAPTPELLARRFLAAVTARDSQSIRDMVISKAEFGWLVFPDHVYRIPPYELDPAIFWLQLSAPSSAGIKEVLGRFGGMPLALDSLACQPDTVQLFRGDMVMWGGCRVHFRTPHEADTRQLFGTIVQRGGVAKFLSYRNEF